MNHAVDSVCVYVCALQTQIFTLIPGQSRIMCTGSYQYSKPLHVNLQGASFQSYKCAPVGQLLDCATVLLKVQYCKIKNVLFCVCLFFVYYLCGKYYKTVTI